MKNKKNKTSLGFAVSPLKKREMKSGFTLFELLVSISIIGILTALASVAFSGAQKKARDARRMQDMKAVQTAAEQYYSQSANYNYPITNSGSWVSGTGSTIIALLPSDPKSTGWTAYSYTQTTSDYCICASMESSTNGNSTTAACAFATSGAYFCVKNQQ